VIIPALARLGHLAALAAILLALAGCEAIPYYSQAAAGEIAVLRAARPIDDWLADPATAPQLKQRLELAQRMRTFASAKLGLPDNRSYRNYAELKRSSVVWDVFAAPAYSLALKTWCYPVFGCAAYRGYFQERDADQLAQELAVEGWDSFVAPVPAYSTLGWFSDPLLSTYINGPETEVARMIFHELAHQILYVRGDTRFNESFATEVEEEGLARWVAERGEPQLAAQFQVSQQRRSDVRALVAQARTELEALYAGTANDAQKQERKQEILHRMHERYVALRDGSWGGYPGYDEAFGQTWNNARIGAMAAYRDYVPAFATMLAQNHGELARFYDAVRALAAKPPAERDAYLQGLMR
jgi:predicted aminopeptidase